MGRQSDTVQTLDSFHFRTWYSDSKNHIFLEVMTFNYLLQVSIFKDEYETGPKNRKLMKQLQEKNCLEWKSFQI